jgi:hypothetical protein
VRRLSRRLPLLGAVLAATVLLAACGSDDRADSSSSSGLPTRTVEAGEVTVKIEPTGMTPSGATFDVAFDTHSVDLNLDIAAGARLVVDGTEWTGAAWDGPGAGGHHREGTLTFDATADPAGTAELTISGLDEPVQAAWDLEAP